ncbi:MAG: hypothetical protein GY928_24420 [Colwellia sp.]|nr:hypothetical protein [Colwellia sp.]
MFKNVGGVPAMLLEIVLIMLMTGNTSCKIKHLLLSTGGSKLVDCTNTFPMYDSKFLEGHAMKRFIDVALQPNKNWSYLKPYGLLYFQQFYIGLDTSYIESMYQYMDSISIDIFGLDLLMRLFISLNTDNRGPVN